MALDKRYDTAEIEKKWARKWIDEKIFPKYRDTDSHTHYHSLGNQPVAVGNDSIAGALSLGDSGHSLANIFVHRVIHHRPRCHARFGGAEASAIESGNRKDGGNPLRPLFLPQALGRTS